MAARPHFDVYGARGDFSPADKSCSREWRGKGAQERPDAPRKFTLDYLTNAISYQFPANHETILVFAKTFPVLSGVFTGPVIAGTYAFVGLAWLLLHWMRAYSCEPLTQPAGEAEEHVSTTPTDTRPDK